MSEINFDYPIMIWEFNGKTWAGEFAEQEFAGLAMGNIRPAIVLDPQDEDVQEWLDPSDPLDGEAWDLAVQSVTAQARAQITPTAPPMEEPQHVGALAQTEDGDIWARNAAGKWLNLSGYGWSRWSEMQNPRPYSEGDK